MMGICQNLKGTAGEAYQMHQYNKMVKKYGEDTTLKILKPELDKVGISTNQFQDYVKVKSAIQNGLLKIAEAKKNAENLSSAAITEVLA